ncbi:MAG: polysaccharide biosynthesis/export family protein [Limnohabitans sp.]
MKPVTVPVTRRIPVSFSLASSLAATLVLAGCAIAPGMRYEEPVADANQPATQAKLVPITPNVIASLKSQGEGDLKALQPIIGSPKPYAMGAGDVLSLTIWDSPQVPVSASSIGPLITQGAINNETATVPSGLTIANDGSVRLPYIGSIKLAGMTEAEATELVTKRLAKFIRDPQITLRVSAYRSKKVFMDGEVRTPGQVVITDVPMTVAEALARAGGATSSGDTSNVVLTREGKQYRINLPLLAKRGLTGASIPLVNGDLLRVAPREEGRVSVMGEVTRPTTLNMRNGQLTLQDALSEAGGVNSTTSNPNQIYVVRNTGPETVPEVYHISARSPVMLAMAENFDLRPKDVVFVDPSPLALWNRVISLILPSAGLTRQTIDIRDATK